MASSQRRLIATLAVAALLAAGLPSTGIAGGSDEPGYTGGSSVSKSGSGTPTSGPTGPPQDPTPTPEPQTTTAQAESAPLVGQQGILNWLTTYWLTIESALSIR